MEHVEWCTWRTWADPIGLISGVMSDAKDWDWSRTTEPLILEKQCIEHHRQNSIYLHCTGINEDISENPISDLLILTLYKYSVFQSSICSLWSVLTLGSTHGAFSLCEWIAVMSCEVTGRAVRSDVCLHSRISPVFLTIMVTNARASVPCKQPQSICFMCVCVCVWEREVLGLRKRNRG